MLVSMNTEGQVSFVVITLLNENIFFKILAYI